MRGAAPPAGTIGAAGGGGGWYAPPTPGPLNRNTVAFTLGSEMKQGVHALTVIVCRICMIAPAQLSLPVWGRRRETLCCLRERAEMTPPF